jgi:hypothetical protein
VSSPWQDRAGATPALIVSEAFARRLWPSGNAIGSRVRLSDRPDADWYTVVGVAGNVYQFDVERGSHTMAVYYPTTQALGAGRQRTLIVGAAMDPAALVPSIKAAIWSVDPRQPIQRVETGEAAYSEFFAPQRFYATLLGIFAAIGALLAAIGLYGLMAYTVAQRTQEFGVRLAIGAQPRDLARLVLGQAARLAAAGTVLGLGAALAATRASGRPADRRRTHRPAHVCRRHARPDHRHAGGVRPPPPPRRARRPRGGPAPRVRPADAKRTSTFAAEARAGATSLSLAEITEGYVFVRPSFLRDLRVCP